MRLRSQSTRVIPSAAARRRSSRIVSGVKPAGPCSIGCGFIGPAKEEDSAGDVLAFANPVFDSANKEQVGSDNGSCVRTAAGKAWECIWTLSLDEGQITVEGPFYDGKDSTLAITGGTDEYKGAGGQMTLHARDPEETEYDFTYEIED